MSLLPSTSVTVPGVPLRTTFSAYTHVLTEEKFYVVLNEEHQLGPAPKPESWNLSSNLFIAFSDDIHEHSFTFYPKLNYEEITYATFRCNICYSHIPTNAPAMLCSEYPADPNCTYNMCMSCWYQLRLNITVPLIEEKLSRVVEGERWFTEPSKKPHISVFQNVVVKKIVSNYLSLKGSVDKGYTSYAGEFLEEHFPPLPYQFEYDEDNKWSNDDNFVVTSLEPAAPTTGDQRFTNNNDVIELEEFGNPGNNYVLLN